MIITKVDVHATLRSMEVGEIITLPAKYLRLTRTAATRMTGKYHVNAMKGGIRVQRYE